MQRKGLGAVTRAPEVIIVVDDDRAVRNSLKFSLEMEGFAVRTYADAHELLAETHYPNRGCLILDYKLPKMNGLELLGELRARDVNLPALLITTHPRPALCEEASRAGVLVVEKPLLGDVLSQSIHRALAGDANKHK